MKPKIVVVGSSNTDMIVKLSHLPKPGEAVLFLKPRTREAQNLFI